MEARLSAIQRSLMVAVLGSVLVALVTVPRLENRKISEAQAELSQIARVHQLDELARLRLEEARNTAPLPLDAIKSAYKARHAPRVRFPEQAAPILPLPIIRIETLADLMRQGTSEASAEVALPDPSDLASALALRLASSEQAGIFSLHSVSLSAHAGVSVEHARRELEVAQLRILSLDEKEKLDKAEKKLALAEYRVDARKKRRSKSLIKFEEALDEARLQRDERAQIYAELKARYDAEAQSQQRFGIEPNQGDRASKPLNGLLPQAALAAVRGSYGKEEVLFYLPVALTRTEIKLAPLTSVPPDLPNVRAAGLWDALQTRTPEASLAHVAAQYNWHRGGLTLLGVSIPGTIILQGLPWLLPVLLLLLNRRIHNAATSHRLFAGTAPTNLPRAGFKSTSREWIALVALPVVATLAAASALLLVGAFPLLPVLATAAVLPLGIRACSRLEGLRALNVSIVQYHSFPPPAMPSLSDPALH